MENNEQMTQNPAIEEGVENATTTKATKKAIDGNEKKKIVKLIQSSILPAKVRIEVNTLVAETKSELDPVTDEVLPEMVDTAEPDEEELVEDNADLDGLNKLQLVEMLEDHPAEHLGQRGHRHAADADQMAAAAGREIIVKFDHGSIAPKMSIDVDRAK